MKKFVPRCHPIWSFVWPPYVIGMSLICAFGFLTNGFDFISDLKRLPWLILIVAITTGLFWFMHKYGITRGLIIDGETLIHKGLWKRKILPQNIVAIKITKAVMGHRYGKDTDLTDKDGNQLYTMFLLKGYMPWAMNEKEGAELTSDHSFQICYGEYAFCSVIYDQEVIDHLLRLNPNIVIC